MTTESVAQSVSNLALSFGDDDADPGAMSRPFGVALLLAGCDEDKVGHVVSLACTLYGRTDHSRSDHSISD